MAVVSQETKNELAMLANSLSNRIKALLGECPLWYQSNRLVRDIDDLPLSREPTEVELANLSSILDKLDATGHEVYIIQFNETFEEISRETGLPIPLIKNQIREYRQQRSEAER